MVAGRCGVCGSEDVSRAFWGSCTSEEFHPSQVIEIADGFGVEGCSQHILAEDIEAFGWAEVHLLRNEDNSSSLGPILRGEKKELISSSKISMRRVVCRRHATCSDMKPLSFRLVYTNSEVSWRNYSSAFCKLVWHLWRQGMLVEAYISGEKMKWIIIEQQWSPYYSLQA